MTAKRMYRRTSVKKISLESLKEVAISKGGAGTCVGLDIGKQEIVAVVRWSDGALECPWSIKNPSEIPELIGLLPMLGETCDSLTIGLESTGTYGEAVRAAMTAAFLEVHRVSGKASSDYKEIFDGVPSQHDGKDAAIIAELTCFGKGTPWPFELLSETDQVIESARTTQGTPIGSGERAWLQEIATELQQSILEVNACRKRLAAIAQSDDSMSDLVDAVGAVTLCVIWSLVGDPRNYDSSGAFLKALGLNLKELSSGMHQGQLSITKRGPSLARKYLYFWALRSSQKPELRRWYSDFQQVGRGSGGSHEHRKMKGVVALMRKLSRSLWYAHTHDEAFDYGKVFPGRPLEKRGRRRRRKVGEHVNRFSEA